MATDLTLYLDDQPGELARVGDVLGKAGTNIAGLCALTTGGGQAEVHILVQDATAAFEALQDAGIKIVAEQEVIVLDMFAQLTCLSSNAESLLGSPTSSSCCDSQYTFSETTFPARSSSCARTKRTLESRASLGNVRACAVPPGVTSILPALRSSRTRPCRS